MSVIVKLLSKFDDSGIKKAKHAFGGLKGAIGAIGIGIGLSQITDLLMESAKAAQDDIKSQSLLATALKRNTGATDAQVIANEKYISSLSKTVGVTDDVLRPALADLTRSTHNVGKAQELLSISFDAAAIKGRSVGAVETAIAKAYNGSTTALSRMFPELKTVQIQYEKTNGKVKKLSDSTKVGALMIKALADESKGAAAEQATPFDKLNVAMDELKEKLGAVVLPLITDFIDQMMKPGGAIDQVGHFLEDLTNPKTDAGKMFTDIKNAVKDAFGHVKDFFALFGNGDAMKGFSNVAKALVTALPALLALKGIMMLAAGGKAIAGLVSAMAAIGGQTALNPDGTPIIAPTGDGKDSKTKVKPKKLDKVKSKISKNSGVLTIATILGGGDLVNTAVVLGAGVAAKNPIGATAELVLSLGGDTRQRTPEEYQRFLLREKGIDPDTGKPIIKGLPGSGIFANGKTFGQGGNNINNVTINVLSADPKATVDALGKYVKTNGGLPKSLFPGVQ
jgi:hypothetical protein